MSYRFLTSSISLLLLAGACAGEDPEAAPPAGTTTPPAGTQAPLPTGSASQTPPLAPPPGGSGETPVTPPPVTPPPVTPPPVTPPPMVPEPPPAAGPSYAETVEPYILAACTTGCHSGSGSLGGKGSATPNSQLDLGMGVGYAELTGAMSLQDPAMPFVGDTVETSYLYVKMAGLQVDGLAMPFGTPAPQAELDKVRAWIEGGAAP